MAIKEIRLEGTCISCGQSQDNVPEVFRLEIGTGAVLVAGVTDYTPYAERLRKAAKDCPVDNITLIEG